MLIDASASAKPDNVEIRDSIKRSRKGVQNCWLQKKNKGRR
jgi:hypothetical protein